MPFSHRLPGPLDGAGADRATWKSEIHGAMNAWSAAIVSIWPGVTLNWVAATNSVDGMDGDELPNEVETDTTYTLPHEKGLGDFRFGKHIVQDALAHMWFPRGGVLGSIGMQGGDGHFNLTEYSWRTNAEESDGFSYNIMNVAAHEIGHGLGLPHSSLSSALMWIGGEAVDATLNGIPSPDKLCLETLYESPDGSLEGACNVEGVSPEQGGRWDKLIDAVNDYNNTGASTTVTITYSFISPDQVAPEQTIQRIGIGSEHGNTCCVCCGPPHGLFDKGEQCYTGCCPCKPPTDLTVTATQWYKQIGTDPAAWTEIEPPCVFTFDLTQRMYECMGSGAQEYDYILVDEYEETTTPMDSVEFLQTYGWPRDGHNIYDGGPDEPECPRDLVDAENRAYNDSIDCDPSSHRGGPIYNDRRLTSCMHPDGPYLGNNNSTDDPDLTADNLKIPSARESWGYTGKICDSLHGGASSENSEGGSTPLPEIPGQKGSYNNPAYEWRTNDCGGMCITAQLCCCRGLNHGAVVKRCAVDRKGIYDGDEGVNYECKTECYKFGIQAYNCYHYSGSVDKEGAERMADGRMNWGDDGPFAGDPIVDGGVTYGLFPQIDREDLEYYVECGADPATSMPPAEGVRRSTKGGKYLNTPCSPCTYLEKATFYPNVPGGAYECLGEGHDYWDEDPDCRNASDEYSPPPFCAYDAEQFPDSPGCFSWAEYGHAGSEATSVPNFCEFYEGAQADTTMDDKQDTESTSSQCNQAVYFPHYGSQCHCPTCNPEKKLILKYTIYMKSSCDCTASILKILVNQHWPGGARTQVIPENYKIDLVITEKD